MEFEKYNPFVVKSNPKTTVSTRERISKTKPKTKLEAKGLRRSMDGVLPHENMKKVDSIYAMGCFVKTSLK